MPRVTDRDEEAPWEWLHLRRSRANDPRIILVRAVCGCGWVVSGDPPFTLGSAAEHFKQHWDRAGELPGLTLTEDHEGEAEVRDIVEEQH